MPTTAPLCAPANAEAEASGPCRRRACERAAGREDGGSAPREGEPRRLVAMRNDGVSKRVCAARLRGVHHQVPQRLFRRQGPGLLHGHVDEVDLQVAAKDGALLGQDEKGGVGAGAEREDL